LSIPELYEAGCRHPCGNVTLSWKDDYPFAVISGIGDSGTRGVFLLLRNLGMRTCPLLTSHSSDNICTKGAHAEVPHLYWCANAHISTPAFRSPNCSAAWNKALKLEELGVSMTWTCQSQSITPALDRRQPWGFKNPLHVYLQPVTQAIFGASAVGVLVARDPRDICSGHNQGQWHHLGSARFASCLLWWGSLWKDVLVHDGSMQRFVVVRIEDLVMHDPQRSNKSLEVVACMADAIGLHYTSEAVRAELAVSSSYNRSYFGGHMTAGERQKWIDKTATTTSIHLPMRLLGYDVSAYTVTHPTFQPRASQQICIPTHGVPRPKPEPKYPPPPPIRDSKNEYSVSVQSCGSPEVGSGLD